MSVDVISILRAQKLAALNRSIAQTERHDKEVAVRAHRATAIVSGEEVSSNPNKNAYLLRDVYNRELENYTRKRVFTGEMNARALALWSRVEKAWATSGVDIDTFVKTQFTYFHNVFKTHPTAVQLTTDGAVLRATSVEVKSVMTNNIAANINLGDLFVRCEKQMSEIMRAQKLSREDVYRKLVKNRLVMFPAAYLNADPVWQRIVKED